MTFKKRPNWIEVLAKYPTIKERFLVLMATLTSEELAILNAKSRQRKQEASR